MPSYPVACILAFYQSRNNSEFARRLKFNKHKCRHREAAAALRSYFLVRLRNRRGAIERRSAKLAKPKAPREQRRGKEARLVPLTSNSRFVFCPFASAGFIKHRAAIKGGGGRERDTRSAPKVSSSSRCEKFAIASRRCIRFKIRKCSMRKMAS